LICQIFRSVIFSVDPSDFQLIRQIFSWSVRFSVDPSDFQSVRFSVDPSDFPLICQIDSSCRIFGWSSTLSPTVHFSVDLSWVDRSVRRSRFFCWSVRFFRLSDFFPSVGFFRPSDFFIRRTVRWGVGWGGHGEIRVGATRCAGIDKDRWWQISVSSLVESAVTAPVDWTTPINRSRQNEPDPGTILEPLSTGAALRVIWTDMASCCASAY